MNITGCYINFTATDITYADTLYIVGAQDGYTYLSKNCTGDVKLSFG